MQRIINISISFSIELEWFEMGNFVVFINFACFLIVSISANKIDCPAGSKGDYPKCLCDDDFPYDAVNNICSTKINVKQLCPKGTEGDFPNCICADGKVYDPHGDKCVEIDKSKCPNGSKSVNNKCVCEHRNGFKYEFDDIFWICRPWYIPTTVPPTTVAPCPTHQRRVGDKCEWEQCPVGYISKTNYWPDCTAPPSCQQKGMIGEYPHCYAAPQTCGYHQTGVHPDCTWLPCPEQYSSKSGFWPDCIAPPTCSDRGLIGVYPDCRPPPPTCPQYHHRNSDGECVRIKCPPGHEGDWQPNCKSVPKCPASYPGIWPHCNIYATVPTTTSTTTTTTTPKPTEKPDCYCKCLKDDVIILSDGYKLDPSHKYKRASNQ